MSFYNYMDSGKAIQHFKSPKVIRSICAKVGLNSDDDIIIYCLKGARASNTLIALKMAGFKHVRKYYGSWNEWSRDAKLPIYDEILIAA